MNLDWTKPGRAEKAVTAEFIQSDEARAIRQIVPDPPPYDAEQGRFVSAKPVTPRQLKDSLAALEAALPVILGLHTPVITTCEGWDDLTDKVLAAEKNHDDQGREVWHRIWHGIGNTSKVVDAWIEVIPNEYGLAVVKTAVAVIFKLAAKSVEKRKKIAQAFEDIQRAMTSANPVNGSFRSHHVVAVALDELYQAIVDSVNDMIVLTAKEEHFWRGLRKKLTQRTTRPDVNSVLQLMSEKTEGLKTALGIARDQSIETIDKTTKYTAIETTYVRRGLDNLDDRVDLQRGELRDVSTIVKEQGKKIDSLLESMWLDKQARAEAHSLNPPDEPSVEWLNKLMDVLVSQKKDSCIQALTNREPRTPARRRRGAVVNAQQFCEALADPPFNEDDTPDIEGFLSQPDSDWSEISMYRGDFDSKTQSRVQSLLQQGRFLSWMKGSYPDVLLVLADLPTSGMERITAVSVFCATLVTSLINLRRDDVVLHFFCGLHLDPQDPSPGPAGLVRSLIMQVFTYLRRDDFLSLDFLNDRAIVRDIEDQDLVILCQTLQSLLDQFHAGTQVFCIVDSITLFDREEWSSDLKIVLEYLHETVDDSRLPAIVKVVLTSSALCSPELSDLVTRDDRYPNRVLSLASENISMDGEMGDYEMERHISQVSITPRSGRYKPECDTERSQRYEDDYA